MNRRKKVREFPAVDTKGKRHMIAEYTTLAPAQNNQRTEWLPGHPEFQLASTGERLHQINETEFFAPLSEMTLHVKL